MGERQSLQPFSYEPAALGPFDVEIGITHCGICHSDLHLIDNDWGISAYPLVPGHEIVGKVARRGSQVTHLEAGTRVGVGWQRSSCGACEWCRRGAQTCCSQQQATCVGHHGGFANRIVVDSRFAFPIPEALPAETAAPLLCGGATVYTPMRNWARPDSRVGVIGIGGLGHLALQFAHAFGCEVTAFSTSPEKETEAREFGAHNFVVSGGPNGLKPLRGSLDILLTTIPADLNWAEWMQLLRPRGALVFVGASPGAITLAPMGLIMGQNSVTGSAIGDPGGIVEMLDFAARHGIQAKTEVLPLDQVNTALDKVRNNTARYRMVLSV
jgi:alcohol/geraniol dehydrogenase (NADP+)